MKENSLDNLLSATLQRQLRELLWLLPKSNDQLICVLMFEHANEFIGFGCHDEPQLKELVDILSIKRNQLDISQFSAIEIAQKISIHPLIEFPFKKKLVVRYFPIESATDVNCTAWFLQSEKSLLDKSQDSLISFLIAQISSLLHAENSKEKVLNNEIEGVKDLEFLAPFHAILRKDGSVLRMSELMKVCTNWSGLTFPDQFEFMAPFNFEEWCQSQDQQTSRLYFFNNGALQRF